MTWRPLPGSSEVIEPKPIRTSLDRLASTLGVFNASEFSLIFLQWKQTVGSAVAAHARPLLIRDGALTVTVDQPAWATQLRLLSPQLIQRLNELVQTNLINRIEIRVRPSR